MKNEQSLKGTNFFIREDSLIWLTVDDNKPHSVAIQDVSYIIRRNRLLGGIEGFFIGTLWGAVTGLMAAGVYKSSGGGGGCGTCGSGLDLAVIIWFAGAVGGTTIGIVLGDRDEYQFDQYSIPEHRKKE